MRYHLVIRQHGVSGGLPGPGGGGHCSSTSVTGWSRGSAQRNALFLQSVKPPVGCLGIAVTLTCRTLPSLSDWRSMVRTYCRFLSKSMVVSCYHYVTEWQRRGVPHLHLVVYLQIADTAWSTWMVLLRRFWSDISDSAMQSNYAYPVTDLVGWLQYVAKHAARGVNHYQRASLPEDWKGLATGRMWGYGGNWPERKEGKLSMSRADFVIFSRLLRKYMVKQGRPKRAMIQKKDSELTYPRGVFEWVDNKVVTRFLDYLVSLPTSDLYFLESSS